MHAELKSIERLLDTTADADLLPLLTYLDALLDQAWVRFHLAQREKPTPVDLATVPRDAERLPPTLGPTSAEPADLTVKQVSELLAMSECWVRRHQSMLGAVYHGSRVRFPQRSIERYRQRLARVAAA